MLKRFAKVSSGFVLLSLVAILSLCFVSPCGAAQLAVNLPVEPTQVAELLSGVAGFIPPTSPWHGLVALLAQLVTLGAYLIGRNHGSSK